VRFSSKGDRIIVPQNFSVVRAGLNWHFNLGGPLATRD
jgi:hypothetical protein